MHVFFLEVIHGRQLMVYRQQNLKHVTKWLEHRRIGNLRRDPYVYDPHLTGDLYNYTLYGHTKCVNTITFSHGDNRYLASGGSHALTLALGFGRVLVHPPPFPQ